MSYKSGEKIGKYIVTRDFGTANGGQGQWGFAKYKDEEYFIKKFLSPVYPEKNTPGSEKGKQKKKVKCQKFERRHLSIMKALQGCGSGGLVVTTTDFFKHGNESGSHYFKATQKVDTSNLSNKVYTLDRKRRLFVMLTSAGALKILHKNNIIHLDLKPDNILIQEWNGKLIAKIIDFDSSIIAGEAIDSEELVGDQVYFSPEFAKYIRSGGDELPPTKKSDIFSLGLMFCQYWTGKLPHFPNEYNYAYGALLDGAKLELPKISSVTKEEELIDTSVFQLIQGMLEIDPHERISIEEVHNNLKKIRSGKVIDSTPKFNRKTENNKSDKGSRIQGTLTKKTLKDEKIDAIPKTETYIGKSRVKFNFRNRK